MKTGLFTGMLATLMAALTALSSPAMADTILLHTGGAPDGKGSTYHQGMGAGVVEALDPILDEYGLEIARKPSGGATDNAAQVASGADMLELGIGQGGLSYPEVDSGDVIIVRKDLPGECAMAFTTEPAIGSWGDIVKNAGRITWVVPENSGSAAFLERLYAEDENFQGNTPSFQYVSGADNILATVTDPANRGTVGFYYAYPNPTDGLVNMAAEADANIFGVLSPDIARTDDAYYLNRKAPYELSWFGLGETKTTRAMCSKALLFAKNPETIEDSWAAADARDILKKIESLPASAFIPEGGPLAKLMTEVEGLSEEYGVNDMVEDLETQIRDAAR